MAKILAREYGIEINTGTFVAPVWQEIGGINSLTMGRSKTDADTKDFGTDGWDEHIVAGRGRTVSFDGHLVTDPVTGVHDPGQAECEAATDQIGWNSVDNDFQFTEPSGAGKRFFGSVDAGPTGGGINDPAGWTCAVTVQGQPTDVPA